VLGIRTSFWKIWRSWVRASQTYFQVQPTRCNVTQFIYFCEMLHMFQTVPPPIIRSSKTVYTASDTLSNLYCYLPLSWQLALKGWQSIRCCIYSFWAPDDGRRNRLKHVEHFAEINKLCNVASRWLHLKILSSLKFFLTKTSAAIYFNILINILIICTVHLLLFCTVNNKFTVISQIITLLLHVSTLLCHPQGIRS
jgi:hypothetical protein